MHVFLRLIDQLTSENMWVGLMNDQMVNCDDNPATTAKPPCDPFLSWTDGSNFTRLSSWTELKASSSIPCFRYKKDSNLIFEAMACQFRLPFLCQFDCNNVYTGECSIELLIFQDISHRLS